MFKIVKKLNETTSNSVCFFIRKNYSEKIIKSETFTENLKDHIKCESLRYRKYDGKEPISKYRVTFNNLTGNFEGPRGSEITRFGYWEYKGRGAESDNKNWKQIYHENVTALREMNPTLPENVDLLEKSCGSKVYVVGTHHHSAQSSNDVKYIMNKTLPDCVILELCRFRSHLLLSNNLRIEKLMNKFAESLKELGFMNIIIGSLLGLVSEKYRTSTGGEFKTAFDKANELPCCHVILGDRDMDITLKRALKPLGFGERIKFIFALLFHLQFSKQIEKFPKQSAIDESTNQMKLTVPSFYRAVVEERDLYLTRSIWDSVLPIDEEGEIPSINVAVVGRGHCPGIIKNWETAANIDLFQLSK